MNVHTRPPTTLTWIADAGRPLWPRDLELAGRAVVKHKEAVLLGVGSVVYVRTRLHAAPQ
jgi:hypothetical protein